MSQLHLIRSKVSWEAENIYEEKTDVWVMGDVAGYTSLRVAIAKAMRDKRPVLLPHQRKSNSMRLCILPAASLPIRAARLKLVERIVFFGRAPEMELIIYGNRAGYKWLSDCLKMACTRLLDDPSEHIHLDDWHDRRIVRRSVAVNIRGALSKWSRAGLQQYDTIVFDRQPTYLPAGIEYLSKESFPYRPPTAEEEPFQLR